MKQKQIQKKRTIKKSKKFLLIDYDQLKVSEMVATVKEITTRLFRHFKDHVGKDESTSPVDIFEAVIGLHPEEVGIYKREYWWNVIKKIMSQLRKSEDLFIVHSGQKWFVLQSTEELSGYKRNVKNVIRGLENSITRAERWVQNKSWQNI